MKILIGCLSALAICLLAIAGAASWCWVDLNTSVEVKPDLQVEIPVGYTPDETIAKLSEVGVIKHSLPLRLYLKTSHAGRLFKAGVYSFPSPVAPLAVLKILQSGGKPFGKLTVIEGWTRWDIAQELMKFPSLHLKNRDEALKLMNNTSSIKDLDKGAKNLEGYLFPDTYFFDSKATPQELIEQMVARFHQIWKEKLADTARGEKLTPHTIVTIASLIETEAKLAQDRPMIASVVYNRVGKKMPLQLDSSLIYAAKLANTWKYDGKVHQSDIDRVSPYNTYNIQGLPPGPIGSPGLDAMMAVTKPASSNYLYYVRNPSRNDGAHNFYSTAADFEVGVQALRDWEKKQLQNVKPKGSDKK